MLKNIIRLLVTAAMCVTATLVAPTAANAVALEWGYVTAHSWQSGNASNCQKNFTATAQGCYFRDGDFLAIADIDSDSMRAGMHWETTGGRRGVCVQSNGQDANPTSYWLNGAYACNKSFPPGDQIHMRVGRCNGSAVNCEVLSNWGDWSGWTPWLSV